MYRYADLLAAEDGEYTWPELDERSAAAMCYTSGTTGDPRGVVYSHRSTFLHALATLTNACTGASEADRQLTIVPMFHVNAWGIPFAAFLAGTTMHMPDRYMTPAGLVDFIEAERSTLASAVPTIWGGILQVGAQREIDLEDPAPDGGDGRGQRGPLGLDEVDCSGSCTGPACAWWCRPGTQQTGCPRR